MLALPVLKFGEGIVTEDVIIEIEGKEVIEAVLVARDDVLIGQTVLENSGLLVDCKNQHLIPNPKYPDGPVFRI